MVDKDDVRPGILQHPGCCQSDFQQGFLHQVYVGTVGNSHFEVPAHPLVPEAPVGHLLADEFRVGYDHRCIVEGLHDRGAHIDFLDFGPQSADLHVVPDLNGSFE